MGRSKLTEKDKLEIQKLSDEGWTKAALAKKYGVHFNTILRALDPEYYAKSLLQSAEYQREHGKTIRKRRAQTYREYGLSFHKEKDSDIIRQLDKMENIHDYIRMLIKEDIQKGN